MADPPVGMKALAECLRPDGVAALMLYARYGRAGVELMQAIFRELGLRQDEESLAMVKAAIATLAPTHPLGGATWRSPRTWSSTPVWWTPSCTAATAVTPPTAAASLSRRPVWCSRIGS